MLGSSYQASPERSHLAFLREWYKHGER